MWEAKAYLPFPPEELLLELVGEGRLSRLKLQSLGHHRLRREPGGQATEKRQEKTI